MTALAWLIPVALFLGGLGLAAFLWALHSGQFEDLDGAAYRALEDDPPNPTGTKLTNSMESAGPATHPIRTSGSKSASP